MADSSASDQNQSAMLPRRGGDIRVEWRHPASRDRDSPANTSETGSGSSALTAYTTRPEAQDQQIIQSPVDGSTSHKVPARMCIRKLSSNQSLGENAVPQGLLARLRGNSQGNSSRSNTQVDEEHPIIVEDALDHIIYDGQCSHCDARSCSCTAETGAAHHGTSSASDANGASLTPPTGMALGVESQLAKSTNSIMTEGFCLHCVVNSCPCVYTPAVGTRHAAKELAHARQISAQGTGMNAQAYMVSPHVTFRNPLVTDLEQGAQSSSAPAGPSTSASHSHAEEGESPVMTDEYEEVTHTTRVTTRAAVFATVDRPATPFPGFTAPANHENSYYDPGRDPGHDSGHDSDPGEHDFEYEHAHAQAFAAAVLSDHGNNVVPVGHPNDMELNQFNVDLEAQQGAPGAGRAANPIVVAPPVVVHAGSRSEGHFTRAYAAQLEDEHRRGHVFPSNGAERRGCRCCSGYRWCHRMYALLVGVVLLIIIGVIIHGAVSREW